MSHLKIAVVVGSIRPGRNGKGVADWVLAQAQGRAGVSYELVDLANYLAAPGRAAAAGVGAVPTRPHQDVGGEGGRVRRVRVRHPGVQPLDLGGVEERDRLLERRVEQQGRSAGRLRRGRRGPGPGAPARDAQRGAGRARASGAGLLVLHRLRTLRRLRTGHPPGRVRSGHVRPARGLGRGTQAAPRRRAGSGVNLVVWIVTGLLAVVFAMAGAMKLAKSKAQLVENPAMGWAADFSPIVLK